MTTTHQTLRLTRKNTPFGPDMTDYDVWKLFSIPEIAAIDKAKFPASNPLEDVLKNDTRIRRYKPGEIIVREGDYGNSAFLVLNGKLRLVLSPGLPNYILEQKQPPPKKNLWQSLGQLMTKRRIPEVRDPESYANPANLEIGQDGNQHSVFLQDFSTVLNSSNTALLEEGTLFGELAALRRIPRSGTVFSESHSELLEIRWQGLRELRRYDKNWRRLIEKRYSKNGLVAFLKKIPLFEHLQEEALQEISDNAVFKSYGTYDWAVPYKSVRGGNEGIKNEPVIIRQGDYPNDLYIVRAGFARVSKRMEGGDQTITYLGVGHTYGADELFRTWEGEKNVSFHASITALGYVDILQVPAIFLDKHVFPHQKFRHNPSKNYKKPSNSEQEFASTFNQSTADKSLLEWTVQERFINGTQTMLINLDRCVRCDDCVNACATAHDGNPRFIRHGKKFGNWMVANACMHCMDPVCMIGCPTGAITRDVAEGTVVINDSTCIGCETCADSCPYSNIQMVEINDKYGNPVLDLETHKPILKATKCDLCIDQLGGPACVRACSQGALQRVDFHHVRPEDPVDRSVI